MAKRRDNAHRRTEANGTISITKSQEQRSRVNANGETDEAMCRHRRSCLSRRVSGLEKKKKHIRMALNPKRPGSIYLRYYSAHNLRVENAVFNSGAKSCFSHGAFGHCRLGISGGSQELSTRIVSLRCASSCDLAIRFVCKSWKNLSRTSSDSRSLAKFVVKVWPHSSHWQLGEELCQAG